MKLHANAALSLNQRRRMVRRVVDEEWSRTQAAEAAEVSERTCSKWGHALPGAGRAGAARSFLGAAFHTAPHRGGPCRGDREAA